MTFVKSSDPKTAELLEEQGFVLFCRESDKYVFIVDEEQLKKYSLDNQLITTSKLCFNR